MPTFYEDKLSCRLLGGTLKRIDDLRPYIAATYKNRPIPVRNVQRAFVVRMLIEFALEVFERRQAAWEHENNAT
tara:strand:+ start:267 stop:488 length:222 start_codon:yes stop_codon:yes gene_type:complete